MARATPQPVEAAIAAVHDVDAVGVPLGPGVPAGFVHALASRDWDGLEVSGALLTDLFEVFSKPNVRYLSGFFGPIERLLADSGADIDFVPSDFRRFAPILEKRKPRVMATVCAPPDAEGWCSLSLHAGATVAELHRAGADPDRVLVVEVNPSFPRTLGLLPDHRHAIHVDEIDVLVEHDAPPFELVDLVPTEVETAIARHALDFVEDGSTLQTGIGGIPSAVASLLAELPGGDYGIHSEMFTTGLMRLHQAGKVTNHKGHGGQRSEWDGLSITTFALGTAELYEWLDGNELVRFLPVDLVNSPEGISANPRMIAINGAICMDLQGQVVADTITSGETGGTKQYSGIGGHEDFMASSGLELEDRSLICMSSTVTVGGETFSRITPQLAPGSIVTTPRHQLDVVVTEYGSAHLRGRTVRERAQALAAIAHPNFRAELDEAASIA